MSEVHTLRRSMEDVRIPYRYPVDGLRTLRRHYRVVTDPHVIEREGLAVNDGRLRVVYYAQDAGACGYYRAFTQCDVLRGSDSVLAYPSPILSRALVDWADVIVWQRVASDVSVKLARELRTNGRHVFDIDDDLFSIPKWNPSHAGISTPSYRRNLTAMLEMFPTVTVTTPALARALHRRTSATFAIVPNAILPERYVPHPNTDGTVRIGWQGSATHLRDLQSILPALHALRARYSHVRLVVFGWSGSTDRGNVFAGLDVEHHPIVPPHKFPSALAALRLDIGLAPLVSERFNDGKSPIKWEEYSALGIPTVASAVGPYAAAIEHGKTGLLVKYPDKFHHYVEHLILNADARRSLGQRARAHVLATYGTDAARANLERILLSLPPPPPC